MHSRLRQYLGEMELKLRSLPDEERESDIEELRQHLELMVAAYQEMDCSEEEAVSRAIKNFGPSKTIAVKILKASRQADEHRVSGRLCMAGWSLFLISMLLPTMTVFGATLYGFNCALIVLYPVQPLTTSNVWGELWYHWLGLANILMLTSPILLNKLKNTRSQGCLSALFALAVAAIVPLMFNTSWGIGFYAWLASYCLVFAGTLARVLGLRSVRSAIES